MNLVLRYIDNRLAHVDEVNNRVEKVLRAFYAGDKDFLDTITDLCGGSR